MEAKTKAVLVGAALFVGALLFLLLFPVPAHSQPPGMGDDWTANGWTTWTCALDTLVYAGGDSTDFKMVAFKDNYASQLTGTAQTVLNIGGVGPTSNKVRRGLVWWDVSFLPTSVEVVDAAVRFSVTALGSALVNNTDYSLNLYRVLDRWYETGTDSMWIDCRESRAWATAGCSRDSLNWGYIQMTGADAWNGALYPSSGCDTLTIAATTTADRDGNYIRLPYHNIDDATYNVFPLYGHITEWVRGWKLNQENSARGFPNYGMLMQHSDESTMNRYVTAATGSYNASANNYGRARPTLWIATRAKAGTGSSTIGSGFHGIN